jgi:DNA-binding NarL/FixJ family response regulator
MLLTKREFEVARLISLGFIVKEIAEEIFLSPRTIEAHKNHIFKNNKGIRNVADLVREFLLQYGDPEKITVQQFKAWH